MLNYVVKVVSLSKINRLTIQSFFFFFSSTTNVCRTTECGTAKCTQHIKFKCLYRK